MKITFHFSAGSVYCDKSIRMTGFNGEYIKSGSVLVVKTHYHRELFWTDYDKLMIRSAGHAYTHTHREVAKYVSKWNLDPLIEDSLK